jgi:AcrR family transcriptional regulator
VVVPRKRLTRDAVVAAALKIIDRQGVEALTMRRLGQTLGVEAMAVYRHVANKDDLIAGVVERLFSEFDVPEPEPQSWRTGVHEAFDSYADIAERHPKAFPLLVGDPAFVGEALRRSDRLFALFRAGGFDNEETLLAVATLASYADGFMLPHVAHKAKKRGQSQRRSRRSDADVATPNIDATIPHRERVYSREGFHDAIDTILDGLEARVRRRRKTGLRR